MSDPSAALAQLFGVGIVWLSVHCVCMCGPLLTGLDVTAARRGSSVLGGAGRLLVYQSGRAATYALLGASAGLLGGSLDAVFTQAGAVLSVTMGAVLIGVTLRKAYRQHHAVSAQSTPQPSPELVTLKRAAKTPAERSRWNVSAGITRIGQRVAALQEEHGLVATYLLGAVLGLMPCMVTLWALGLAALTGSAGYGALVMLCLVALTTPVLLAATGALGHAGRLLPFLRVGNLSALWRTRLERTAMLLSGALLVLVGLAGADIIDHAHISFFGSSGRHYMLMFW